MTTPFIDIIVPVWNQPFETRACLVSVLQTVQDENFRLVLINNSCNRETELLLEEFADRLGERVLYMSMERNIGFVPAANRGLARSVADWALVVRPTSLLKPGWWQTVTTVAEAAEIGIVTPLCTNELHAPRQLAKTSCCSIETCTISFAGVLLSRAMRERIGTFDEELDGAHWCLRDYQQRAAAAGYLTVLAPGAVVESGPALVFGSDERRRTREEFSADACRSRWGVPADYIVHLPKETEDSHLETALQTMLAAARKGHRFTVCMHRRQFQLAAAQGWCCLHTGIELVQLAQLGAARDLRKRITRLQGVTPEIKIVKGVDGIPVPGYDSALPFSAIAHLTKESASCTA